MFLKKLLIIFTVIVSPCMALAQSAPDIEQGETEHETQERHVVQLPAVNSVVVTVCTASGSIAVRGWDKSEVLVVAGDDQRVELRREDKTTVGPAEKVNVIVSDAEEEGAHQPECNSSEDITLNVPHGANLFVKTREGDVSIDGVGEAHLNTVSGSLNAQNVANAVDMDSATGDLAVGNSAGNIRLGSVAGNIVASDLNSTNVNNVFVAKSISGDICMSSVGHQQVQVSSTSGDVSVAGPLLKGARYKLNTTSGDVSLSLPEDASFKFSGRVFQGGDIVTDFPLKFSNEPLPVKVISEGKLTGSYGSGDASLEVSSFSGTIRLSKRQ
jgi:DUF4097 and DUF4098 domain-containing protein YvlB